MGKIYIDDSIIKSKEWSSGEFNKWQALIDLYLMADKSKDKAVVKTSERKLSERWGWSRKKVQSFIKELESNGTTEGTTKGTTEGTTITLENTGFIGIEDTTQGTTKGTTEGTTKNTKNQIVAIRQEYEIYFPNDEKLNRAFVGYLKMRETIGLNNSDDNIKILIKRLNQFSANQSGAMDNDLAIDILEQATVGQWKNIHSLKEEKRQGRNLIEEWRNA